MDHYDFLEALRLIRQRAKARQAGPDSSTSGAAHASRNAAQWHAEAIACSQAGQTDAALSAWRHALACPIRNLQLVTEIGDGLRTLGLEPVLALDANPAQAIDSSAPSTEPRPAPLPATLVALALRDDWLGALPLLEDDLADHPTSLRRADNLALALTRLGQDTRARCVRATTLAEREDWQAASAIFIDLPQQVVQDTDTLTLMLTALHHCGHEAQALAVASTAVERGLSSAKVRLRWAWILMDLGRATEAIAVLASGAVEHDDPYLSLQSGLIATPVPATLETVQADDARAMALLRTLAGQALPTQPHALARLAYSLDPCFYASYRDSPNLQAIRDYGNYVSRVIEASHGGTKRISARRNPSAGRKLRIGYVIRQASNHTVTRHFAGWLHNTDAERFETHLFPLTHKRDWMSLYLQGQVDIVHAATEDFDAAIAAIRDADLDLLVHIAIGMDPLTLQIAALRLAPVQCAIWGHPVSTGLPTIDYFISAGSMEPADGNRHYTERLVTLPGIGVTIPETTLPAVSVTRAELGIPEQAAVYVSAQSLFKYMPQYDDLYARIAREVGNAIFVFAEGDIPAWTRTFRKRIEAPFHALGIAPEQHIRILPQRGLDEYFALLRCCDMMLDTVGWSGGQTSYDALACDLPIVTVPGVMMRGRQTYGMLRHLEIEDTIAADVDDYVRIAVRLGQDRAWRNDVARRIRERKHLLYGDQRPLRALEAFYRWATGVPASGDAEQFKLWPPNPDL